MTYSYNVPLDWQKVLNEIHHRLTQAYGHLEMIEIRRPKNRIECFYKGENKKLFRFLFNIAITDKIVSISIRQLHEDFTLQLDTEIDCKDTNISPELMEYLVKGHRSLYSMSASDLMSLSTFVLGSATSRS